MARSIGTMKISSNIEPRLGAPLDARMVVPTQADLTTSDNWPYAYVGMLVAVQATGKVYILKATPVTTAANWAEVGSTTDLSNYYTKGEVDALITSVYKPSGSVAFNSLPVLSSEVLGNVYNVTNSFTTTNDFVEGAGKTYPANTNVVVVNTGTTADPVYMFDALSGLIDMTGYQIKMQYVDMPTASQSNEGEVVQYLGATTSDFTHGHFYECNARVPISGGDVEYVWREIDVQESSGSGGSLESPITVTTPAGGITQGKEYAIGTTYEQMLHDLLDPHLYPQLTAPTGVLSASVSTLQKTGATPSVTFTLSLNRGSISPAYGTNGYRSGEITGCKFDGAAEYSTTYTYTQTVSAISGTRFSKVFTGNVSYAAGERPKDSKGDYYSAEALAAGNVDTNTIKFEFASPLWSNAASISTIAEESLISASTGTKTFNFPACTSAQPWVFDVPAAWTVSSVTAYNSITREWDNVVSEFTITDTTHPDATGNVNIAYKRYTFNKGIDNDARQTKVTWTVS